jgi:hypothetical protein
MPDTAIRPSYSSSIPHSSGHYAGYSSPQGRATGSLYSDVYGTSDFVPATPSNPRYPEVDSRGYRIPDSMKDVRIEDTYFDYMGRNRIIRR